MTPAALDLHFARCARATGPASTAAIGFPAGQATKGTAP